MCKHKQMKKVSIITPCYNAEAFLQQTIQSVLQQTFTHWEWIITDDHSTDRSLEILRKNSNSRILVLQTQKNSGAGAARNLALKKASGRYITFLDADDYWEPNFLEEMVQFMEAEKAELAYCSYSRCDEQLKPKIDDFKAQEKVTFENMLKTCRLSLLASMYDSTRVGKEFFPQDSKREDHIMWLNLLKKIPEGKPLKKTLAKYRMHGNSVSRNKMSIIRDQYLVYRQHMEFSSLSSLFYTFIWAVNGFKKYSRIFN